MDIGLSNSEFVIIAIGALGLIWKLGSSLLLHSFRKSLKSEQLVGVMFAPDTIVNCRIVRVNAKESFCVVNDCRSDRLVMIELHNIFMADPHSSEPNRSFEMY